MYRKLPFGIIISLFLFCNSVVAERFLVGSVYTDQPNGITVAVNLPPVLDASPKASDFQLLNDGGLIKNADAVESFIGSDKRLVLLFLVDVSRSINKSLLKETQDALINLLSETSPNVSYRFGLASFADEVTFHSELTDNPDALIQSIRGLRIATPKKGGNKTLLYQALIDSLHKMNELGPGEYRRLLIISDGKDEDSIETHDSVINLSKALGIPIDAIGRGIIAEQYTDQLSGLAKATGGRFVYPRGESLSLKEAVVRIHKSAIENTWLVRFDYTPDPNNPMLTDAVIQFRQGGTSTVSSPVPVAIPDIAAPSTAIAPPRSAPRQEETPPGKLTRTLASLKDRFAVDFALIGVVLLIIATLIYLAWLFRDHWLHWTRRKTGETGPPDSLPAGAGPVRQNPAQRRQTEVISDLKLQNLPPEDLPGILLEMTTGPLQGRKIRVDKRRYRIGADKDNDLVLNDDFVSGNHALLSHENGVLLISDLHSRNGTRLNGEWLKDKTSQVAPGSIIQIGTSTMKIIET
ncbi:MAG: FHA domain-containing protein [Gammaproteobacteria bacterium]